MLPVVAQGTLETPVAQAVFLQQKDGVFAGHGGLDKRLFAQCAEVTLGSLHTHQPTESGNGFVLHFQAAITGLVGEAGCHCAPLDLVMLVVGVAGADADLGDACHWLAVFTPQVPALAAQLHKGHAVVITFMVMAFLTFVVMPVVTAMQVVGVGVAAFK